MQIADNIEYCRVYWVRGTMPRGMRASYAVSKPPTSGWQGTVVIRGDKRSTLFCPFSFESWPVSNDCAELSGAKYDVEFNRDWFVRHMTKTWAEFQRYGWNRDYDTAARVLQALGEPVPEQVQKGGGEDVRKKGGKPVCDTLLKVVKLDSKRGRFLEWFMRGENHSTRSVREAMVEFSMTRSNALSYLYMIQKDNGIGYTLIGDQATIQLPEGCHNPFDADLPEGCDVDMFDEADDDSWLD